MNAKLLVLAVAVLLGSTVAWAGCSASGPAPAAPVLSETAPAPAASESPEPCPVCRTGFIDELEWERIVEAEG